MAAKQTNTKPTKRARRRSWTDADKERAIAVYTTNGNLTRTSKETGVPISTLRGWLAEMPAEEVQQARLDARVAFVKDAWTTITAYLKHLAKEATMKGTSAYDGARVVGILVDKVNVMEGKPTAIERFEGQVQHEHEHAHSLTLRQLLEKRGREQGTEDDPGDSGEPVGGDPLPALLRRRDSLTR